MFTSTRTLNVHVPLRSLLLAAFEASEAPNVTLGSQPLVPQQPPVAIPWNRVGLTHISFNVRGTDRWYDYLVKKGVECVSKPEQSPRGHTFFFAKDMDGNLIELMDLGYMHHVLGWLGPLGGFLFRRGRYKKYYEAPPR